MPLLCRTRDFAPRIRFAALLGVSLASVATSALAQDAGAPTTSAAAQTADDGEITVTALRRSSTVQETPLAITALTGTNLANAGVTNVNDYAKLVPSLRIQDNGPGQRRISLRGILASGEPTVGVYYDETPIAGSVGVSSDAGGRSPDFSLFDLERIEVLRGPQGTLYGSSSMSGSIRVIFAKPTQELEGAADATVGSIKGGGLTYNLNGVINVPIVKDLLAARLVLYRRDASGYVDNSYLGKKNVDDYTADGGRLLLRLTPSPDVTIDGSVILENTDAVSNAWNPQAGKYTSQAQVILPYIDRSRIYNLTGRWDLGPISLTGVTSYQHRKSAYAADDSYYIDSYLTPKNCASYVNGGGACSAPQLSNYYDYVNGLSPAAIYYPGKTTDLTNEFRVGSTGEHNLTWTAGLFHENRKNSVTSEDARADATTGEIISPNQVFFRRTIEDQYKQIAAFAEGSYKIIPPFTLTVGARYYDYKKTVTGQTDIPWTLIGAGAKPLTTVSTKQNGWIFKFNGSYEFSRDILAYVQAAQGFRPGGANQVIGLAAGLTPYKADSVWSYEAGLKTAFADRRIFVNAAVYQTDWKDIQVSGRTLNNAFSFLSNAGAARIRGAELEINTRPVEGMQLSANASYSDAKLTKDQISDVVSAPGRAGDRLPYIPHVAGAVTAEYTWPVSHALNMYARADVNYVGSSYSELRPTNVLRIKMDDYALANARVGFEKPDGHWGAYLFVNNVFDSVAINRASQSSTPNSYSVTSATPRTVGVNVRTRF